MRKSLLVLLGAFVLCGAVFVGCNNNVEPTKPDPSTTPTETTELAIALLNPQENSSMLLYADGDYIPSTEAWLINPVNYPKLTLVEVTKDKNGNITKTTVLLNVTWTCDSDIAINHMDIFHVEVTDNGMNTEAGFFYPVKASYRESEMTVYIHGSK